MRLFMSVVFKFSNGDATQEDQYELPYHYIPQWQSSCFSQHLYWSWGYRYLGGILLVLDLIKNINFSSILDVGCGDGRFIAEVKKVIPGKKMLGIDCSQKAIAMAQALNTHLHYQCLDIVTEKYNGPLFDVLTLIEVLEHIPKDKVGNFILACSCYLKPAGKLIVTVPHCNKPLILKHYQHFNSTMVTKLLDKYFKIEKIIYFDKKSRLFRLIDKLLANSLFVLNNQLLLNCIFRIYRKYFFFCQERNCGRVCIQASKR